MATKELYYILDEEPSDGEEYKESENENPVGNEMDIDDREDQTWDPSETEQVIESIREISHEGKDLAKLREELYQLGSKVYYFARALSQLKAAFSEDWALDIWQSVFAASEPALDTDLLQLLGPAVAANNKPLVHFFLNQGSSTRENVRRSGYRWQTPLGHCNGKPEFKEIRELLLDYGAVGDRVAIQDKYYYFLVEGEPARIWISEVTTLPKAELEESKKYVSDKRKQLTETLQVSDAFRNMDFEIAVKVVNIMVDFVYWNNEKPSSNHQTYIMELLEGQEVMFLEDQTITLNAIKAGVFASCREYMENPDGSFHCISFSLTNSKDDKQISPRKRKRVISRMTQGKGKVISFKDNSGSSLHTRKKARGRPRGRSRKSTSTTSTSTITTKITAKKACACPLYHFPSSLNNPSMVYIQNQLAQTSLPEEP